MKKENQKYKICMLSSAHSAFDDRIFYRESKSLSQTGYDVVIIAQHDKEEIIDNIKIIPLPIPKNRLHRMTKTVWKLFMLALKEKADVYHFHDPELMPIGVLLKLKGKKIIYDVHEDYEQKVLSKDWIKKEFRKAISFFIGIIEKVFNLFFDYVITADSNTKMKFKKNKVEVLANFPPLSFMKNIIFDKEKSSFILIYAGGISKDRGIVKMIEAMKYLRHKDIELHLLGSVNDQNLLKIFNSTTKVKYHGIVPWEEVNKYLAVADIGLILLQPVPAYIYYPGENLIKLFEYMSIGLPIIFSDFPNLKKFILKIGCGIPVDPTDSKEIAKTIDYLYENVNQRERMGEKGKEAILEKYNWNIEKNKLLKIYKEIIR